MPSRIEDYALIGDCEAAALIARNGSLDWLCWPRFDSDACFAALLGSGDHGHWQIAPRDGRVAITRRYRPHTLILETRFESSEGVVSLVDFMPVPAMRSSVVRLVIGEKGQVTMCTELVLRFGYGAIVPWVPRLDDGALRAIAGPDMVVLRTPVHLVGQNLTTVAEFTVAAGEIVPFVLTYAPSHGGAPEPLDPESALKETGRFWRDWSRRCRPPGHCSDPVLRSLITLKALTYGPTGGIVAAPTTSLPERLGGVRNWDYRFCWLRDATLTLLAFLNGGYHEEANAWRTWLLRAAAGDPAALQIMYGVAGERRLTELELPWLPGYERSKPVRVGNAAIEQFQLDVYGEVMDALHQGRTHDLPRSKEAWALQRHLLRHLEHAWKEPDEGIWEVRGPRRHFTHSKVMAWVAFDRGVQAVERFDRTGPVDRWRRVRAEIHDEVLRKGFDTELNSFVGFYGGKRLDASLLVIPLVGFLPADDPRIVGTVAAIESELVRDGFVQRYAADEETVLIDGLPPGEGAFLPCTFWLVDNLALQGRLDEARELFERLLALRSDLGLPAEEDDPELRPQLRNYPQAFTHVALVNTAYNLECADKRMETSAMLQRRPEEQPTAAGY